MFVNWTTHTHTHTHTTTRAGIQTDDLIFFRVYWCVSAQTVTTCVCIRSEDTHISKRTITEDTHHVIGWTDDTHMFQTTGDFITKSIFFSYFHLGHKTEIQVCYTLYSREISREK